MNKYYLNKKILVTGGAGFIGAHLVKKLVSLGADVSVIDNLSRGKKQRLKDVIKDIHFYKADLRDEKKVKSQFEDQEIIFNLAALNTGIDYDSGRTEVMFEDNMMLQMMPLRMAKNSKTVKKFIQISSASVYSREAMENQIPTPETADTNNPEPSKLGYALAKQMGERLATWYNQNTQLKTVAVRFINVYGEDDNFDDMGHFIPVMVRKFVDAKKTVEVFGSGKQKRSFLYVEDAVSALLILARKGKSGEVYNVDSNCEKSVGEIVKEISKHFIHKKLKIVFNKNKPEGSQRRMLDNSKLKKLGWNAKKSFNEGLDLTIKNIEKLHST